MSRNYRIIYSDTFWEHFKKIPVNWQERILRAINGLTKVPFKGKKLKEELTGLYSVKIWPYRIIYMIKESQIIIVIVDLGHRQNVYK